MELWLDHCAAHDKFTSRTLGVLMAEHPDATVLRHLDSSEAVIELADVVGSTPQMVQTCQKLPHENSSSPPARTARTAREWR